MRIPSLADLVLFIFTFLFWIFLLVHALISQQTRSNSINAVFSLPNRTVLTHAPPTCQDTTFKGRLSEKGEVHRKSWNIHALPQAHGYLRSQLEYFLYPGPTYIQVR
ncbi:hypothetical protein BDY19DRAFT_147808 [Irpex rosettiformis]|uniref:Uncharacterized protein n=1 Tax=Irpex rosettiformis TaxID=378272 RepID=A0ACB8U380_9APHY|nr:hypothetical protein BDY19DRAFT_147808 [Irpex rosettiformis]